MTLSFGLWWFAGAIVYIQIAPFLVEKGFTTASAATYVIVFGAANSPDRFRLALRPDRQRLELSGRSPNLRRRQFGFRGQRRDNRDRRDRRRAGIWRRRGFRGTDSRQRRSIRHPGGGGHDGHGLGVDGNLGRGRTAGERVCLRRGAILWDWPFMAVVPSFFSHFF